MLSGRKRCRDDDHHLLRKRPKFQDDVAEEEADLVVKDDVAEEQVDLVVMDDVAEEQDDAVAEEDDVAEEQDDAVVKDEDDDALAKDEVELVAKEDNKDDVAEDDSDDLAEFRLPEEEEERKRRKKLKKLKLKKKIGGRNLQAPGQGSYADGCCGEECQSLVLVGYKKQKHGEDWDEAPTDLNLPVLWMVQCPTGKERELAVGLMQNSKVVHDINNHDKLLIRSAISLDHLHNDIYVESGLERHVRKACKALDESYYATSKMTLVSIEDTIVVLGLDSKSVDLSRDATHENNGNAPSPAWPSTPDGHKLMISSKSVLYIPGGQPMSL